MLGATISDGTNKYYIYLDKNNMSIKMVNKKEIRYLNKNEARNLFKLVFDGPKFFLKQTDEYKIYIDEYGNKRFFKDNLEDFEKFFRYNGINAIMTKDGKITDKVKTFILNNHKKIILTCTLASVIIWSINIDLILSSNPDYKDVKYSVIEKVVEVNDNSELTVDEIVDNIYSSTGENMDEAKKSYFSNRNFFEVVLRNASSIRKSELLERTKNLYIHYYDETDKKEHPDTSGYYNNLHPNRLNYLNDSDKIFRKAGAHEFVHLAQESNEYSYIREACAEIMAKEFFGEPERTYTEAIKRVKVLMEIIGPEPILECNFRGYTTNFEHTIQDLIGKDAQKEFCKLLTNSPEDENKKEINEDIDEYLKMLYKAKYNDDIENNPVIKMIYDGSHLVRYYFNDKKTYYYRNTVLHEKKAKIVKIDKESIAEEDIEVIIVNKRKEITEEEFNSYKNIFNNIGRDIVYEINNYKSRISLGTEDYDNKRIKLDVKEGKAKIEYYLIEPELLYSLGDIDEDLVENYSFTIILKDGTYIEHLSKYSGYLLSDCEDTYPSIDMLFNHEENVKKINM